jgi:hypothetical protein
MWSEEKGYVPGPHSITEDGTEEGEKEEMAL